MKSFHRLRVRFAECEVSQNEVAKAAGMSPSTMSSRMAGTQPFTTTEISTICKMLGIPMAEAHLYFWEGQ